MGKRGRNKFGSDQLISRLIPSVTSPLWPQVSSKDEDFLDLSVDVEQNTSITHCLRWHEQQSAETWWIYYDDDNDGSLSDKCVCVSRTEASATRKRCVVNTSTTVSSVAVNRKRRRGERRQIFAVDKSTWLNSCTNFVNGEYCGSRSRLQLRPVM